MSAAGNQTALAGAGMVVAARTPTVAATSRPRRNLRGVGNADTRMTNTPAFLDRAWQRLREEVSKGHQAYIVCPRIGSDNDDGPDGDEEKRPTPDVTEVAPLLASGPLQGLRLGVLHGKLAAEEKDAVMQAFSAGKLDVIVATTVIEVGVDVPNATVTIILDTERFWDLSIASATGAGRPWLGAGFVLACHRGFGGYPESRTTGQRSVHIGWFQPGRAGS